VLGAVGPGPKPRVYPDEATSDLEVSPLPQRLEGPHDGLALGLDHRSHLLVGVAGRDHGPFPAHHPLALGEHVQRTPGKDAYQALTLSQSEETTSALSA
jgi:hypothetical protein